MNEIDPATAAALGWPRPKYAWVERERRWLCRSVPPDRVTGSEVYEDPYVTGTQLRLRGATPTDGAPPLLRLGRKADVSPSVRLLTSIHLSPEEFRLLASLPGRRLRKTRHALGKLDGAEVFVYVFEGELTGLVMAEAEFETVEAMQAWPMPDFAYEEVTDHLRYTGGRSPPTACRRLPSPEGRLPALTRAWHPEPRPSTRSLGDRLQPIAVAKHAVHGQDLFHPAALGRAPRFWGKSGEAERSRPCRWPQARARRRKSAR